MPVRKIPRSYRAVTGATASVKVGRAVASESTLECDVFTLLEFDPDVDRYEEQPLTVLYRDADGRARHYTPDVLVWFREDVAPGCWRRPLLAEVKYRVDLAGQWRALQRRLAAARAHAAARGWEFRILTEREVRTPYLANARFLLPFRRRPATEESSVRERLLLDALEDMREADAETLLLYVHRDERLRLELLPELWRLVAWRAIRADLRLPLTMRSRLWLASPSAAMPEHGRWLPW